jgi:hypothetical protein
MALGPFTDRDGDGVDDYSGLGAHEHELAQGMDDEELAAFLERTGSASRPHEENISDEAREAAAEYWESGQGQADLDAGREPTYPRDPDEAANAALAAERERVAALQRREVNGEMVEADGTPVAGGGGLSEFDQTSADIPVWSWLSGAGGRRDRFDRLNERQQNQDIWFGVGRSAPSADDLAVEYGAEGFIEGPDETALSRAEADPDAIEAERRALGFFEDVATSGGMTAADRARMQLGASEVGQTMRGQRDADMNALQARGMGGSGAQIASALGAQQSGAMGMSTRDAQMQMHAEDRALDAMSQAGSMGSRMRGESWGEESDRARSLDDLRERDLGARRENQRWNSQQENRTRESRSDARQQQFENSQSVAAGATNQYSTDVASRDRAAQRRDDDDKDKLAGIAELF